MGLSGTRLLRAIERFQEWCDLEERDLERRLGELDGEDPELAAGVRELLEEDRQAVGSGNQDDISLDRERLGRWMAETTAPQEGPETAVRRAMPERIGDYRVLGILGVGGMGVVYRAEQDSPRRPVAVKVVHPTSLSSERRKRLRQEAEILGRLEHPGIARIYSAGTDEFGAGPQPYFAMEFVEGRPLARYCDAAGSSTRQRVELLVQVCEAVDYAHRLGIVHRDLKPDNVLVQPDGQPRVLDFGVARSIEPGTDATSLRTEDGRLVGTLSYMSPEQVEGVSEGLTPACDVYSLGAMLFELLAGRTPHDLEGEGLLGALQVLQSKDPDRLGSLRSDLRGDLDRIVGKALQREPERRYATAGELADDLGRYLRKEPILAREPSTLYELRRFVARNPALVAGVVSTLLVLVVGVVASFALTLRAQSGERLARQQTYIASIRAVDADLRLGDSSQALEDLDALTAETRGWEWDHLVTRVRDSFAVLVDDVDRAVGVAVLDPRGPDVAFVRQGQLWRYDGASRSQRPWLSTEAAVQRISPLNPRGEFAIACEDGSLWRASAADDELRLLASLPSPVRDLAWCDRREEWLIMADRVLWGVRADGALRTIVELDEERRMLQFAYSESLDTLLVSLSRLGANQKSSGLARGFSAASGELLWESRGETAGRAPAVDPTGQVAFLGTTWGEGRLVDVATGKGEPLPGQSTGSTRTALFSPGGTRLFTSNGGRSLEIRNLSDGEFEKRAEISALLFGGELSAPGGAKAPEERGGSAISSAVWLDEGSMLIERRGKLYRWSLDFTGSQRLEANDYAYDLRFSGDGRWLLFREFRGDWVLVDALLRREVARLPKWTKQACFAGDGTSLLLHAGSWCRVDLGSLEWLELLEDADADPESNALEASGLVNRIAQGNPVRMQPAQVLHASRRQFLQQGRWLRLRSLAGGGEELSVEQDSSSPNRGVAWHPERGWIASANGPVRIYDDRSLELLASLGSRSQATYAVAFHPDGSRLATGGADGEIVLWATDGWTPILTLRGHDLYVRALEFSPDGRVLASASGDRSVRLWDTQPREDRERELQRIWEARPGVRAAVQALIDAGTADLAAAVQREFPTGPQRAAAQSWMHELAGGGALPLVSTSANERMRDLVRARRAAAEPEPGE